MPDDLAPDDLAGRQCKPCNAETPPIEGTAVARYMQHLGPRWQVVDDHHLSVRIELDDFVSALELANRIGRLAEDEGHHPEICVTWGRLTVRIWTHAIDGLSENDFILAAKIDRIS